MLLLQVHFIRNWKMRTVEDVKPVRYGYIYAGWRTGIFTVMIPSCIRVDIKFLSRLVYLLFITFYYAFYLISIDIKYTCRGFSTPFVTLHFFRIIFCRSKRREQSLAHIFIYLNLCYYLFKKKNLHFLQFKVLQFKDFFKSKTIFSQNFVVDQF